MYRLISYHPEKTVVMRMIFPQNKKVVRRRCE
jgi:hypothetical protein